MKLLSLAFISISILTSQTIFSKEQVAVYSCGDSKSPVSVDVAYYGENFQSARFWVNYNKLKTNFDSGLVSAISIKSENKLMFQGRKSQDEDQFKDYVVISINNAQPLHLAYTQTGIGMGDQGETLLDCKKVTNIDTVADFDKLSLACPSNGIDIYYNKIDKNIRASGNYLSGATVNYSENDPFVDLEFSDPDASHAFSFNRLQLTEDEYTTGISYLRIRKNNDLPPRRLPDASKNELCMNMEGIF